MTNVTDEQLRALAATADPRVQAGMMTVEVQTCLGFPGDTIPGDTIPDAES